MDQEIISRFSFHKPDAEGIAKMSAIRKTVRLLVDQIDKICPASKEKEMALLLLSNVMMLSNSAISQSYPIDEKE